MSRQNSGFIGLGFTGASMAGRLIAAGHRFFVHTRSAIPESITAPASWTENAQQAEVMFLMLPDTPDVSLERFDETGMSLEQHSQFEIGQQSSP